MHANKREEIRRSWPAIFAAAVGLRTVLDGDTIARRPEHPIVLECDHLPDSGDPSLRVRAQDQGTSTSWRSWSGRSETGAGRSTFRVSTDPETGQTISPAMELHLESLSIA